MVGTKSRGYSNSGQLSEGEYSMPFFCTRHSPSFKTFYVILLCGYCFTGRPVNFVSPVKFVTCRKNAQGQVILTFKEMEYLLSAARYTYMP